MATNPQSGAQPFSLSLKNGMTITGIEFVNPSMSTPSKKHHPLLACIHGASCTAHNFDVSPSNTIESTANTFAVPTVSINRPGYLDSSHLCTKVPEDSTFHQELGKFYHQVFFPALFSKYAQLYDCSALVILAHSIAVPAVIVASALHARDDSPLYPLAGIIMTGWGTQPHHHRPPHPTLATQLQWKTEVMTSHPRVTNLCDQSVMQAIAPSWHPCPISDREELGNGKWKAAWRSYSNDIQCPIKFALGEHDVLWVGTVQHVDEFRACFPQTRLWSGSVLNRAPHAIEWSKVGSDWYDSCFQWAQDRCHDMALNHRADMQECQIIGETT